MKKFKQLVLYSSAYTVLFALILYVFLWASGIGEHGLGVDKFLLVLGYGILLSGANMLYSVLNLRSFPKTLIHFGILLCGFIALYILTMGASSVNAGRIFIAVFVFLAVYAAVRLISYGIRRLIGKYAMPEENAAKPKKEKPVYTSRFGNG